MVSHIGAGGPQHEEVTFTKALLFALIGALLIIAFYFWWPQESERPKLEDQPKPAKVKPAESRTEEPTITAIGGDWVPSNTERWRSFQACREYAYQPSGLITAIPGTQDISQCDFAANLATKTPIITDAFTIMMRSGGAPDDLHRLVRACQRIVLPMLDDWSYLSNRPEFDAQATRPYIALALRCQVLVRDFPKPDSRPGDAVLRQAQPLLADTRVY